MLEDGNCSGIYKVDMLIGKFEQIIRGFFSARKKDPTDIGSFFRVVQNGATMYVIIV